MLRAPLRVEGAPRAAPAPREEPTQVCLILWASMLAVWETVRQSRKRLQLFELTFLIVCWLFVCCRHVQQPWHAEPITANLRKPPADAEHAVCSVHAQHDAVTGPKPRVGIPGKERRRIHMHAKRFVRHYNRKGTKSKPNLMQKHVFISLVCDYVWNPRFIRGIGTFKRVQMLILIFNCLIPPRISICAK